MNSDFHNTFIQTIEVIFMFFKKEDSLDDSVIVVIAINIATEFRKLELKTGTTSAQESLYWVNRIKNEVLKNYKVNPNKKSLEFLSLASNSLSLSVNAVEFVNKISKRFESGNRNIFESEIEEALMLVEESVQKWIKSS